MLKAKDFLEISKSYLNRSILISKDLSNEYLTPKNVLKAVVAVSVSYFGYYTLSLYFKRRKYSHIPGPSTKGIFEFYFGNFDFNEMNNGKLMSDYILEWHQEFGPVIKFQLVNDIMISTTDQDALKDYFQKFSKKTKFNSFGRYIYGQRYLGLGLVSETDHEVWKHQRAIYNPGFHRSVLLSFIKSFNVKSDILMERLRTLADGKTIIKLFPELNRMTFDAIAIVAFGMNIETTNGKDTVLFDSMNSTFRFLGEYFMNPFYMLNPFNWSNVISFRNKTKYFRSIGKEKIMERIKTFDPNEDSDQNDILTNIVKSSKEGNLDLETMVDNFLTFFLAGQETTANTLAFCFLEIAKNKEIFNKCRSEVDEVLGSRTEITNEDIPKLKYIGSVFKESLRLFPPAPEVSRLAPKGYHIAGYELPCDTDMMVSTYACSRLESNFQNSLEFKPERFLKDSNNMNTNILPYAYFPFSLGPRNCLGQNFAQIEGVIIIARIVQSFDIVLDLNQSMKMFQDIMMKPADGAKVILSLRK